jgi:serine/threonine-protein kinase
MDVAPQYTYPPSGPNRLVRPPIQENRPEKSMLPAILAIAGVLLLAVVGVVIGVVVNQDSDSGPAPSTVAYPSAAPSSYQAEPSLTARPSTATAAADPEAELQSLANGDHSYVTAQLADHWVPQLSSKRPGVVDAGVVWDNAMTLQEHQQLRARYPNVRLLWSGDWSTFSASNYWVTVAGITFPNSAGALAWCKGQGFDRDHCAAKLVSTTHPVDGSTAYN